MQGLPRGDADGLDADTIDDDIIIFDSYGAERVSDLSLLPEDQWLDALRPLSRLDRIRAQNTVSLQKVGLVGALIGDAARLFGMRPNVLARVLVVRGVDRALRDARRDA